jgi:hypothetical protein
MGLEDLLMGLQEPATGPFPEPDKCSSLPTLHFPKSHSDIIISPTLVSSDWSLLFFVSD